MSTERTYQENLVIQYQDSFRSSSEYELVNCFNIETSHNGWVGRRGCYIKALVQAMQDKKIDVSEITSVENGYHAVHLRYPVFYRESDKKVVQIRQEWLKTKF